MNVAYNNIIEFNTIRLNLKNNTKNKTERSENYKENFHTGKGSQTVLPIKDINDIKKINDLFISKKQFRNMMLFTLGCNLSLRASDLRQLTWGQIFTINNNGKVDYINDFSVIEKKTSKLKYLKLNSVCKKAVDMYLEYMNLNKEDVNLQGYLFESRKKDKDGNKCPIEVRSINKIIKNACEEIGLEGNYATHTMRKTYAYQYYMKTKDIGKLMQILNHSKQKTTLRYIGLTKDSILESYDLVGEVMVNIL